MNWFSYVRRDFVGRFALEHGQVNRKDLVRIFGISSAQASLDIEEFQIQAGRPLRYCIKAKTYFWDGTPADLPARPHWQPMLSDLGRNGQAWGPGLKPDPFA